MKLLKEIVEPQKQLPKNLEKSKTNAVELEKIWKNLVYSFFPDFKVLDYQLSWSGRSQKRTLASCNIRRRKVTVARELQDPEFLQWLEPLLYHELCHAILAEIYKPGMIKAHGREFKELERKHPLIKDFNQWIKLGGWVRAIRKDRGKRAYLKRLR